MFPFIFHKTTVNTQHLVREDTFLFARATLWFTLCLVSAFWFSFIWLRTVFECEQRIMLKCDTTVLSRVVQNVILIPGIYSCYKVRWLLSKTISAALLCLFSFTFTVATTFARAKPTSTTAVSTLHRAGMRVHVVVQLGMIWKRKTKENMSTCSSMQEEMRKIDPTCDMPAVSLALVHTYTHTHTQTHVIGVNECSVLL